MAKTPRRTTSTLLWIAAKIFSAVGWAVGVAGSLLGALIHFGVALHWFEVRWYWGLLAVGTPVLSTLVMLARLFRLGQRDEFATLILGILAVIFLSALGIGFIAVSRAISRRSRQALAAPVIGEDDLSAILHGRERADARWPKS